MIGFHHFSALRAPEKYFTNQSTDVEVFEDETEMNSVRNDISMLCNQNKPFFQKSVVSVTPELHTSANKRSEYELYSSSTDSQKGINESNKFFSNFSEDF